MSQSGTLNFGTIAFDATTLTMTGGTPTSTAAMTVSGLTTLSSGTIFRLWARSTLNGGILFNVSNATFTLDGRTLTNSSRSNGNLDRPFTSTIGTSSDARVFDNLGVFQDQCTAGQRKS